MATLKVFVLFFAAIFAVEAQQQGTVVLYNNGASSSNSAGIVRVYYNGQWGNICDDYYDDFGYAEANVVCHQLGYAGAYDYSTAGSENYGTDTSPTLLTDVDCYSSSYLVLLRCDHSNYSGGCTNDDDITVDCYTTPIWDSPFSGMVRLQNGTYSSDGRVEVYCNGQWGTVCDDYGFTDETGDTVCKQLGYSGAYSLTSDAGNDYSLPTWLDDVDCSSYEDCLSNCQSCPSSSVYCSDGDAEVTCEYSTSSGNYYNTQDTCLFADSSLPIGAIVGIIIGSIFLFLFCIFLAIMIPLCICCCLGIGIGAAAGGGRRYDTI